MVALAFMLVEEAWWLGRWFNAGRLAEGMFSLLTHSMGLRNWVWVLGLPSSPKPLFF